MDVFLLVSRLVLACIFLAAALSKLADSTGSRRALIDFGIPPIVVPPLAILLPLTELAISLLLIPVTTAWWGAVGGFALLLLFVAGISFNLAQGRTPDCHCFGQLHSAPVGWATLVRNVLLAAIAGLIIWQGKEHPGYSIIGLLGSLQPDQLIGIIFGVFVILLVAIEGWFVFHLLRQNGRLLHRVEALEANRVATAEAAPQSASKSTPGRSIGTLAPAFTLEDLHGEMLSLDALRAMGKPVLLVFSDPRCGPCNSLLPDVARWQREHHDELTIVLISRGALDINLDKSEEYGLARVLLQQNHEVSQMYKVTGTPTAVLVLANGAIGSHLAQGADAISNLILHTIGGNEISFMDITTFS